MFRELRGCVAGILLAVSVSACAATPPKTSLPMWQPTEAALAGKAFHQSQPESIDVAFHPGGRADLNFVSDGKRYKDATWEIDGHEIVVRWKRATRLTFYGPDANGGFDFTNPKYGGQVFHLSPK
jgi:hypothetical protein